MAPTYKLKYFNFGGLGEPIRYLLSYGKIPFEDERYDFSEFGEIKSQLPFGQVPLLEVDGKVAWQTSAICRYLAKIVGLAGKDDWEALQIDAITDSITDLRLKYTSHIIERDDETRKAKLLEDLINTHNPYFLPRFEKIVIDNKGFFVNGKLTWVDVFFAAVAIVFDKVTKKSLLDDYPALKKLRNHVENLPGIKEYIAKRPETML